MKLKKTAVAAGLFCAKSEDVRATLRMYWLEDRRHAYILLGFWAFTFLLWSGPLFWAKSGQVYCLAFVATALVMRKRKHTCTALRVKFPPSYSKFEIAREGRNAIQVNTKHSQRSYCPILFARFSALIKDFRNWLDLIVVAELCEEIVRAELTASLQDSAS